MEFRKTQWSPVVRWVEGTSGAWLIYLGSRQKGPARWVLSLYGTGILAHAATNWDLAQGLTLLFTPVVRLKRTLRVYAPIEIVFDFWKNFSNFPKFMSFVKSVEVNDFGGLHWKVHGPAGSTVEWDAQLTHLSPHDRISWRSLPRSAIMNEGDVRFRATKEYDVTELDVELVYAPPAKAVGYAAAHFLGFNPAERLRGDLNKMKSMVEQEFQSLLRRGA